jgi:hypothetical protein
MTNFFDFHKDKLVVYFNNTNFKETIFNYGNSFFKDDVLNFIKENTSTGNPSVVYWETPLFTLIPQSIFHSKHISNYLDLNFGELAKDFDFHFDLLHSQQAVIVYAIPRWIKELKETYYPIIPLKHHAGQLIARTRGELNDFVSLVIYKEHFLITILKNGKLQICNSIEYQNDIDILYFLMLHQQKLTLSSTCKLTIYDFEATFPMNQIKESFTNFKEFENYQISWNDKNEFYKTIFCV